MAHDNHASASSDVPEDMVIRHRFGWHVFTRGVLYASLATAGVLLFLLVIAKL